MGKMAKRILKPGSRQGVDTTKILRVVGSVISTFCKEHDLDESKYEGLKKRIAGQLVNHLNQAGNLEQLFLIKEPVSFRALLKEYQTMQKRIIGLLTQINRLESNQNKKKTIKQKISKYLPF